MGSDSGERWCSTSRRNWLDHQSRFAVPPEVWWNGHLASSGMVLSLLFGKWGANGTVQHVSARAARYSISSRLAQASSVFIGFLDFERGGHSRKADRIDKMN